MNDAAGATAPSCFVPPSPELYRRIVATRAQLFGEAVAGVGAAVDVLDTRTMTLLLGRRRRLHTFTAAGAPAAAVTGTRRALVLLVDFSDRAATTAQQHYNDLLFSVGVHPTGSMRDFYLEASYGQLTVDGLVSGNSGPTAGWYRAPQAKTFYTNGNFGTGGYPNNAQRLVEDLVALANPFVDFSVYDNDGDGFVDALVVLAAGAGAEVTGNSNDIWSHAWAVPSPVAVDGVSVYRYFIAPEDGRVGVMAHELGHSLMHWPDLYDTDYSSAGTGQWDLMAGGTWNAGGHRPAHPTAWCKLQAGWVTPTTVSGRVAATITPYAANPDVYKLPVGASATEYFLVTNRDDSGFDADLPAAGLIIEHVDETRGGNTDENRYLVDIEQCDGQRHLNLNANRGDATDVWPGGGQSDFGPGTTPGSLAYDGTDGAISVESITVSGDNITAILAVGGATAMSSIVGQWDLTVDWDNDGSPVAAARLTFNADGTWTYSFGGGHWVQVDGTVAWNFTNAAGLIYTGTVTYGTVAGIMGYASAPPNPGSGSFYMLRVTAGPAPDGAQGAVQAADAAGADPVLGVFAGASTADAVTGRV